jgi:hypothetical protein
MGAAHRLKCVCGVAAPLIFTGAWVICSLRQGSRGGYSFRSEHISGLAAPDALARRTMTVGFLGLGAGTLVFSSAVQETTRSRIAPALVRVAGTATLATGVLRRDRMLLGPPPDDPKWRQSRRNDGHDLASLVAYTCMLVAPPAVARALDDRRLTSGIAAATSLSASLMALFASRALEPYNGIVQRAAVSISLAAMAALAGVMAARPAAARELSPRTRRRRG